MCEVDKTIYCPVCREVKVFCCNASATEGYCECGFKLLKTFKYLGCLIE